MTVIVTLSRTDDLDELKNKIIQQGLTFTVLESIPNVLIINGIDLIDFPENFHPDIIAVEQDEPSKFKPVETISINSEPSMGPWGLLRHTSRDRPWGNNIKLPWSGEFNCERTGVNTSLYIVDTGIRTTHQEFGNRATNIYGQEPLHFHGTACSSIAAGNTLGFARSANIFSAVGLDQSDGSGSTTVILNAINACLTHYNNQSNPSVLNLSLSGGSSTSYSAAISNCISSGLVVCAAAANDKLPLASSDVYPAEIKDVILVGGINMDDGPYHYGQYGTNYGTEVDILGASQRCRYAYYSGDTSYGAGSGTSYGTPNISGLVLCLLEDYEKLNSAIQVKYLSKYLYDTATFGKYKPDPRFEPMTPAIGYINPGPGPYEQIPGLTPRV